MSLINKMLQDLDARGGAQAGAASLAIVKPVLRGERRTPLLAAAGALLLAALAAGGYFGWRALQRPAPAAAVVTDPATPIKTILLAPRQAPRAPVPAVQALPVPEAEAEPAAVPADVAPPRPHAPRKAPAIKEMPAEPVPQAPRPAAPKNEPAARAQPAQQRAESEYRRALASLQEGRVGEAIASLEQVLVLDPRHEAARQTLVGLLIENRRPDEAARQLQQALGADPRQPALAMLLARLQIERGWTGIDTLQRTLPYASGNAEYHAFLAGALQRQQRHREAAEQYQAALGTAPGNGVWLMGLGISLQADKRNAEAISAFQRARSSPSLPADLQGFVDRRLQQLSH
jgi:MSHA biogenesis protein MshN